MKSLPQYVAEAFVIEAKIDYDSANIKVNAFDTYVTKNGGPQKIIRKIGQEKWDDKKLKIQPYKDFITAHKEKANNVAEKARRVISSISKNISIKSNELYASDISKDSVTIRAVVDKLDDKEDVFVMHMTPAYPDKSEDFVKYVKMIEAKGFKVSKSYYGRSSATNPPGYNLSRANIEIQVKL